MFGLGEKDFLMRKDFRNRLKKSILWFCVVFLIAYGAGRLYYRVTAGFTVGNITYALPYDSRWDIRDLNLAESKHLDYILSQNFKYLGKGCQSYVFASEDGQYVLKFFKFQRFRQREWLNHFTFIPGMEQYVKEKQKKNGVSSKGSSQVGKSLSRNSNPKPALSMSILISQTTSIKPLFFTIKWA